MNKEKKIPASGSAAAQILTANEQKIKELWQFLKLYILHRPKFHATLASDNINVQHEVIELEPSETEREDDQARLPPSQRKRKTRDQLFINNQSSMIRQVGKNTDTFFSEMGKVFEKAVIPPPPPISVESEPETPKESRDEQFP